MPSRLWYLAAAAIFAIGIAIGISFILPRLMSLGDDFIRVVVPGEHEIELPVAGAYTIFHEPAGTVDGVLYSASDVSGLRVTLSQSGGGEIALTDPAVGSRYNFSGRMGYAVLAFDIDSPGAYRLSAAYDDGRTEPSTILAISSGFASKLVTTILTFVAIMFVSAGLAIAIGVRTFLKRRRFKRQGV